MDIAVLKDKEAILKKYLAGQIFNNEAIMEILIAPVDAELAKFAAEQLRIHYKRMKFDENEKLTVIAILSNGQIVSAKNIVMEDALLDLFPIVEDLYYISDEKGDN